MTAKAYSYIRFSTPEQLKGDSLRRQLHASKKYAEDNGLDLDTELNLQDHGFSAFTGQHRTRGALGIFLNLIEKGQIPKGSTLIIEAFDRLSREKVLDAFNLFSEIIKAGITVVTLNTGQAYTEKNINENFGLLLMSLYEMSAAWGESDRKSKRLKAVWEEKRNNINKKKLTARAPAWLKLSKDKTTFKPIPERVDIVRQIFNMKKNSVGVGTIEKTLNETPGIWKPKKNGWRKSYINKILRNDAVIGRYELHKKRDGKRIPTGEIIEDYYPQIIENELFFQIQDQIKKNKAFGGRTGSIAYLFGGLGKCAYCGSPIRYENKGKPPRGNKYIVCDNAKRGRGCKKHPIRYLPIENLILEYCEGLEVSDLLGKDDLAQAELNTLKSTRNAKSKELENAKTDIENLLDRLQKTNLDSVAVQIENRINNLDEKAKTLEADLTNLDRTIGKLQSKNKNVERNLANTKELIGKMNTMKGEELVGVRKKLRDRLRNLISRIDVAPVGFPLLTEDRIHELIEDLYLDHGWTFEEIEKNIPTWLNRIGNTDFQTIKIHFKTGTVRILQPNAELPLVKEWESTGYPVFFEL